MLIFERKNQVLSLITGKIITRSEMDLVMMKLKICIANLQYLESIVQNNNYLRTTILDLIIELYNIIIGKNRCYDGYDKKGNRLIRKYVQRDYNVIYNDYLRTVEKRKNLTNR